MSLYFYRIFLICRTVLFYKGLTMKQSWVYNWNTFILVWKLHKKSHFTLRAKLDFRLANNHHHPLHDQVFNFLHNVVDQSCGSGSVFWLLCIYGQTFLYVEEIGLVQHFNSKKKQEQFHNPILFFCKSNTSKISMKSVMI